MKEKESRQPRRRPIIRFRRCAEAARFSRSVRNVSREPYDDHGLFRAQFQVVTPRTRHFFVRVSHCAATDRRSYSYRCPFRQRLFAKGFSPKASRPSAPTFVFSSCQKLSRNPVQCSQCNDLKTLRLVLSKRCFLFVHRSSKVRSSKVSFEIVFSIAVKPTLIIFLITIPLEWQIESFNASAYSPKL